MSGGSTPKKGEEEKYYSDEDSGIPFVRVQNLNVDGHLSLNDVKYVNRETHEGLLNRSKVLQDDLLVKITGVGRMAVASVPPIGFEGNINQHIARIRTESRATSEALAAWLNTDIAETLAKRRSTGGTRPALDYPALRSIPVILDEQVQKELSEAYAQYKQAEAKASELLASIDEYLLNELGISLPPEPENTIANRCFFTQRRDLEQRLDSSFYRREFIENQRAIYSAKFEVVAIGDLKADVFQGVGRHLDESSDYILLKVKNIKEHGEIDFSETESISPSSVVARKLLKYGDIISPFIGEAIRQQKFSLFNHISERYIVDNNTGVIRFFDAKISPRFAEIILNSVVVGAQLNRRIGGGGVPFLGTHNAKKIFLPVPPPTIQDAIVIKVNATREDAKRLRLHAQNHLDSARRRIEAILLGEVTV
ncbi:TPA: hypothetical protein ACOJPC_004168 [Vibrio fluvialis]|nr:hypothetical protein [Vibrio fluvialis]EKO3478000.1 hypothetical protein [Vibrio fluvialis]